MESLTTLHTRGRSLFTRLCMTFESIVSTPLDVNNTYLPIVIIITLKTQKSKVIN